MAYLPTGTGGELLTIGEMGGGIQAPMGGWRGAPSPEELAKSRAEFQKWMDETPEGQAFKQQEAERMATGTVIDPAAMQANNVSSGHTASMGSGGATVPPKSGRGAGQPVVGTATQRPGIENFQYLPPDQRVRAWLESEFKADPQGTQERLNQNPNLAGQFVVKDGKIEEKDQGFLVENAWWIIPAVAASGGLALAFAAPAAGAAGAASAAGAGVPAGTGAVATGIGASTVPAGTSIAGVAGGTAAAAGVPTVAGQVATGVGGGTVPAGSAIPAAGAGMKIGNDIWGDVLSGGLSAVQAKLAGNTATDAARIQSESADKAIALIREQQAQAREDNAPWLKAGQDSIKKLAETGFRPWEGGEFQAPTYEDLANDQAYQFRKNELTRGLENQAAAKGKLLTGGTIKDVATFQDNLASQEIDKLYSRARGEYTDAYNQFSNERGAEFNQGAALAGVGQTAANQLTADNRQGTDTIAGLATGVGNSNAAARVAGGNATSGAVSSIGNSALDLLLKRLAA